ncbi:PEGA domain-containing protein [Pyxidicoccus parkwayensis]|uniref:PEGA domain-containing protein n=1 Tax=Pyxidicoccus parkwayensis TaxID=2813578 RepID=A0ABX7NKA3_9BACT|nr:PEGA domain-containing protein [Pyxidicoccus parkwaysis]QSQ18853.1 PEGA domain-containing protein [Pyxidicoccus parkwaysis]
MAVIAGAIACTTPHAAPVRRNAPAPGAELPVEAPAPRHLAEGPGLRFDVYPASAEVIINGQKVGTANSLRSGDGLFAVPPGIHQVSIRSAGYTTWRAEVSVGDRPERIQVSLTPTP